jgi:hypothetical protein
MPKLTGLLMEQVRIRSVVGTLLIAIVAVVGRGVLIGNGGLRHQSAISLGERLPLAWTQ